MPLFELEFKGSTIEIADDLMEAEEEFQDLMAVTGVKEIEIVNIKEVQ